MKFETTTIPDKLASFATAVAALAKSHDIRGFTMKFEPEYERGDMRRYDHGQLEIIFTQTDGRGRPSENLTIQLATTLRMEVIKNPTSHD